MRDHFRVDPTGRNAEELVRWILLDRLGHQGVRKAPSYSTVDWISCHDENEYWHEVKFRNSSEGFFRGQGLRLSQWKKYRNAPGPVWVWKVSPHAWGLQVSVWAWDRFSNASVEVIY